MIEKIYQVLLEESKKAFLLGEVPISAVIVKNQKIIAIAHNLKEYNKSAIAHAEILAIELASKKLNNWRLDGCDIYISLEPCSMCASAIHQSRIDHIYYFVARNKISDEPSLLNQILVEKNCNKNTDIQFIDYKNDLQEILKEFFKNRR